MLDLLEIFAADLHEAMSVIGKYEQRSTLEVIDEWNHDEPMPPTGEIS